MVINMPKYQVTLTEVQRKILALWNQDKTGSYIAYELMMTRSAVMGQLNRLRIKGHISYKTPQRKKLVAGLPLLEAVPAIRVPQTATPKAPPPELDITEMIMAAATKKVDRVKKKRPKHASDSPYQKVMPIPCIWERACRLFVLRRYINRWKNVLQGALRALLCAVFNNQKN